MSLILKSIEEEAADCRAACANLKIGWAWLVHHGILAEPLTEPIESRISYILENKTDNVALRLRLLRPLVEDEAMRSDAELDKARAELNKAIDEYNKVSAEYIKARDEYDNASAEYDKACGEYYKARDEYDKANAEYGKASVEYNKSATTHYHRLFPDSPWNGKTIFAGEYAL
jgi:tetratricopeptide (TPR) repeat protein